MAVGSTAASVGGMLTKDLLIDKYHDWTGKPDTSQQKKYSEWVEHVGMPITRYGFELYHAHAPATATAPSASVSVEARYGSFSIISHHSIR